MSPPRDPPGSTSKPPAACVAQLSGFVTTQADTNKAVEIAWGVKGAKSLKLDMRGNRRQIDGEARQCPVD